MTPRQLPELAPLETGGRVELRLTTGGSTTYEARWFHGDARFNGRATVDEDGEAQIRIDEDGAPEWLVAWTSALLRVLARDHATSGAAWPRRITRWRKQPELRGG